MLQRPSGCCSRIRVLFAQRRRSGILLRVQEASALCAGGAAPGVPVHAEALIGMQLLASEWRSQAAISQLLTRTLTLVLTVTRAQALDSQKLSAPGFTINKAPSKAMATA